MRCPKCGHLDDRVLDSRSARMGDSIRRRRACLKCGHRFTTYEEIVKAKLRVIKRDGRHEDLDRNKLAGGIGRACEKRPISLEQIDNLVDGILTELENEYEREVPTEVIGMKVMDRLEKLDEVAFVRFASVYRRFRDVTQFVSTVDELKAADDTRHHQSRREFLCLAAVGIPALAVFGTGGKKTDETPDLTFLSAKVALMPRSAWTDDVPNADYLTLSDYFDLITVHHQGTTVHQETLTGSVIAEINRVYDGHRSLDYGDIGYHFIVDYAGRVWEGRSLAYQGAHVSGKNERNIGIMAIGNFQEQEPSEKQMAAIVQLVETLRCRFKIERSQIFGHCDLGYTLCPGMYLYPAVLKCRSQQA